MPVTISAIVYKRRRRVVLAFKAVQMCTSTRETGIRLDSTAMASSSGSDYSAMEADMEMDERSMTACSGDAFSLYSFNSVSSYSIYTTLGVSRECKNVMSDKDKCIYNMLGSSSSPVGKACLPLYITLNYSIVCMHDTHTSIHVCVSL